MTSISLSSILPSGKTMAGSRARMGRKQPVWLTSWVQVSPLAMVLIVLFALPTVLFLVVSFFDYDRVGI